MGRRPKHYDMKKDFLSHIKKDEKTGCWLWNLGIFRFRVFLNIDEGSLVLNPRRYCAYMHGYNIQVGRHVTHACVNENCVNPEHTVLKHDRRPISKHTQFYLTFEDLNLGSNRARMYYGRTIVEMREAREATLEVIKRIKREPVKFRLEHIVNMYDVGPDFAKKARQITLQEYNELKTDPNDTGDTPVDENGEEMLPDAKFFR